MGYLEGKVLGQIVGSRGEYSLFSRVPQTIHYSSETCLGPSPKLTVYCGMRSGCFLSPRQTGGPFSIQLERVLLNAVIGNVRLYFIWTVTRLIRSWRGQVHSFVKKQIV